MSRSLTENHTIYGVVLLEHRKSGDFLVRKIIDIFLHPNLKNILFLMALKDLCP